MAIPTPDSLIAVVKPVLDTSAQFITRLGAVMANPDVVKYAYRGGGLFTFYVEGYMNNTGIIETKKALTDAEYQVHRVEQRVGYVPPAWYCNNASVGHNDPEVTGTAQTPFFIVSVSKKKEVK